MSFQKPNKEQDLYTINRKRKEGVALIAHVRDEAATDANDEVIAIIIIICQNRPVNLLGQL